MESYNAFGTGSFQGIRALQSIHAVACVRTHSFFCQVVLHCRVMPYFVYPLPVDGHLACVYENLCSSLCVVTYLHFHWPSQGNWIQAPRGRRASSPGTVKLRLTPPVELGRGSVPSPNCFTVRQPKGAPRITISQCRVSTKSLQYLLNGKTFSFIIRNKTFLQNIVLKVLGS